MNEKAAFEESKKLDPRHRRAINYYLKGHTKKQAAEKAGFSKWSAQDIFNRADVIAEIERRTRLLEKKTQMDLEWILDKLRTIVEAEPGELIEVDEQGRPSLDWRNMSPTLKKAISKLSVTEQHSGKKYGRSKVQVSFDTYDRLAALREIATLLGLRTEQTKIQVEQDIISRLTKTRDRLAQEDNDDDS